mgnify:CR=1 FL=1
MANKKKNKPAPAAAPAPAPAAETKAVKEKAPGFPAFNEDLALFIFQRPKK